MNLIFTYMFFFGLILMIIGYYEWKIRNCHSKVVYKFIDQLDTEKPQNDVVYDKFFTMFQQIPLRI